LQWAATFNKDNGLPSEDIEADEEIDDQTVTQAEELGALDANKIVFH
jgi:hypothetical protein